MYGRKRHSIQVTRKTDSELDAMRRAGQVVGATLQLLAETARPGMTTLELDKLAEEYIRSHGAVPSFLGYRGYPATICVELDDVVVHGIPNDVPLPEGKILGIDLGACVDGYHGDAAITIMLGEVDSQAQRLVKATREALYKGIEQAVAGNRLRNISAAVQAHVEANGYSVVRALVGHGIGRQMHEPPQVPNFVQEGQFAEYDLVLRPGMTIAIEPMVNMGTAAVKQDRDGWTVRTADGKPSAHFEHTVAITKGKPEILTCCPVADD